MESQPQNSEFRNNSENFHPCIWDKNQKLMCRFHIPVPETYHKIKQSFGLPDDSFKSSRTLFTTIPVFSFVMSPCCIVIVTGPMFKW